MNNFELIQSLIQEKAEAEARLSLIPYDGSPEIKENQSGSICTSGKGLEVGLHPHMWMFILMICISYYLEMPRNRAN